MKTSILIIFTLLTISCSTQKKQSGSTGKFIEISFGSGGGFTGAANNYLLKSDRQVFKENNGEFVKINKISKKDIRKISENIRKIDFYNLKYSEKGNMTYFIEIKATDSINKVTWTDISQTPELKDFYKILAAALKQK